MTTAPVRTHGGARKGAGRKALLAGAKQHLLTLDAPTAATFKRLGEGNLSAGARSAASIAADQKERAEAEPRTSGGMLARVSLAASVADEAREEKENRCGLLMMVDPLKVSVHRCHGRHASAFASPAFYELKESIERTAGNRVPILLSKRSDGSFELVYGRLRLQAATELGIPLLAVVRDSWTPAWDEILDMALESTGGNVPWSLFERGTLFQRCLDWGYYPSQRCLAEQLNWSPGDISAALRLVNFPSALIAAFASPRDIERKWTVHLSAALDRDAVGLLAAANELASTSVRLPAKDVFSALKAAVR